MRTFTSHQPQSTRWHLVFLAIFAGASGALCLGKVPAVLGILRSELGLTLVEASALASAFNTLAILFSLFLGLLLTRWSGRQTGVVGLLVIVAGGALALPAAGLAMMLLSRIVEGIGFLLISVAMPAFIVAVTREEDKRLALSLWAVNLPLGAAVGMLLTPWLTAQGGWRLAWLIWMVPQLSALLFLLASSQADELRLRTPQKSINSGHSLRQLTVLRQQALWRNGLAFTLYSLMLWALFVWLPTMLQGTPGIGQSQIALLSALAVVANIPGNLVGAWLLRRGGNARAAHQLGIGPDGALRHTRLLARRVTVVGLWVVPRPLPVGWHGAASHPSVSAGSESGAGATGHRARIFCPARQPRSAAGPPVAGGPDDGQRPLGECSLALCCRFAAGRSALCHGPPVGIKPACRACLSAFAARWAT
nr:MFS transporter [Aeromonas hydrophila]